MQEESVDLRKELDAIYTPLSVAKEEIWRRWNDKALRKKVEDFLGGDIPEVFGKVPVATIGRHILTPNFELLRFQELSEIIDLKPVCLEYLEDKFATENIDKYHLGKFFFNNTSNENGGKKLNTFKIIDFNNIDRKRLCDLKTTSGDTLVNFHHEITNSLKIVKHVDRFDMSALLKKNGSLSGNYYAYYFSLFIFHGILFENYLLSNNQAEFTRDIILLNYKKVYEKFGLKPLIVPLVPIVDENQLHWRYYPGYLRNEMSNLVKLKNR